MKLHISHHLLLCVSSKKASCCEHKKAIESWEKLKEVLRDQHLENPQRKEGIVLRSKVDCLRVCEEGPILLIWPDGTWYKQVTPERIELIIRNHIINGNPIKKFIFKETPLEKIANH